MPRSPSMKQILDSPAITSCRPLVAAWGVVDMKEQLPGLGRAPNHRGTLATRPNLLLYAKAKAVVSRQWSVVRKSKTKQRTKRPQCQKPPTLSLKKRSDKGGATA